MSVTVSCLCATVRVFDSAGRRKVAPGPGSSQWSSPCEGNKKKVEVGVRVECAEDVKSSKGTTMTARATWRARREDGYFYHDTTFSHAKKIHVCGSVECARVFGGWAARSFNRVVFFQELSCQSIMDIPRMSVCSFTNLLVTWNNCFNFRLG